LGIHPFHEKIMNHKVIKWPDTILNLPNYELLADLIERANLSMSPAELHGLATGLLVADTSASENRFLQLVCEEPEQGDVLAVENTQLLLALFQATQEALQTITLEFELLVPDDDEPLADRIDAACEWARSLLYGLAEQGVHQRTDLSEDVSGFVRDLMEIARGGYAYEKGEEGEMVYADLLEYLRMGALMVQEELQPIKAAPRLLH